MMEIIKKYHDEIKDITKKLCALELRIVLSHSNGDNISLLAELERLIKEWEGV